MGLEMAGKTRHLKEKNGRFYARIAVPAALRSAIGKSELVTPLGGDRRAALRLLPEAAAALLRRLDEARPEGAVAAKLPREDVVRSLSIEQLAIKSYKDRLRQDSMLRESSGGAGVPINTDYAALLRDGMAGRLTVEALDELVGHRIQGFRDRGDTDVQHGSDAWRRLAMGICASEYEALERAFERDEGNFDGKPRHPILQFLDEPDPIAPVDLMDLWDQYVAARQKEGSMLDGGRRQILAVKSLISFTKKSNANDLTKNDIHVWQEDLLKTLSARTIAKVYLPTIRSLFAWAVKKDKMEMNPAADASQRAPKVVRNRESGYTTPEALLQLNACLAYQPKLSPLGRPLENIKATATKRWVPLLCAFTGARIGEMTQLRREDIRQEEGHWIARITPEAGTVKTKQYRDVPLHPQVLELGFLDYVDGVPSGPLFHMSPEASRNKTYAQKMANRLRDWLHEEKLVPKDLQPCHGWRHRFKTVGLELGIAERVIDAIQGHAGRRSADHYGDVTLRARTDAITRLPPFQLG